MSSYRKRNRDCCSYCLCDPCCCPTVVKGPQGPQGPPGPSEPKSAFRALNNTLPQSFIAGIFNKVFYPNEQFDLNNEYTPATSVFIPRQSGIYSIIASTDFLPDHQGQDQRISMAIFVNNVPVALSENFRSAAVPGGSLVATSVSTIIQLKPGDVVDARILITGDSGSLFLFSLGGIANQFEAARFPSP